MRLTDDQSGGEMKVKERRPKGSYSETFKKITKERARKLVDDNKQNVIDHSHNASFYRVKIPHSDLFKVYVVEKGPQRIPRVFAWNSVTKDWQFIVAYKQDRQFLEAVLLMELLEK